MARSTSAASSTSAKSIKKTPIVKTPIAKKHKVRAASAASLGADTPQTPSLATDGGSTPGTPAALSSLPFSDPPLGDVDAFVKDFPLYKHMVVTVYQIVRDLHCVEFLGHTDKDFDTDSSSDLGLNQNIDVEKSISETSFCFFFENKCFGHKLILKQFVFACRRTVFVFESGAVAYHCIRI